MGVQQGDPEGDPNLENDENDDSQGTGCGVLFWDVTWWGLLVGVCGALAHPFYGPRASTHAHSHALAHA